MLTRSSIFLVIFLSGVRSTLATDWVYYPPSTTDDWEKCTPYYIGTFAFEVDGGSNNDNYRVREPPQVHSF